MKTGDAIRKRITELRTERGMSEYRLARKTLLAPSTVKSVLQASQGPRRPTRSQSSAPVLGSQCGNSTIPPCSKTRIRLGRMRWKGSKRILRGEAAVAAASLHYSMYQIPLALLSLVCQHRVYNLKCNTTICHT